MVEKNKEVERSEKIKSEKDKEIALLKNVIERIQKAR